MQRLMNLMGILLCSGMLFTSAQGGQPAQTEDAGSGATVEVAEDGTLGQYLTDQEGNSLYLFLPDRMPEGGEPVAENEVALSTCYDECAENWPPYLLRPAEDNPVQGEVAGNPIAGEGTQADMLEEITREDALSGWTQVAYGGWPLYYFAGDEQAGDTNGPGLGDVWYLVSPMGEPLGVEQAEESSNGSEAAGDGQQTNTQTGGAQSGGANAPDGDATVQVGESERFGEHLVDSSGMPLYMYQNDSENSSSCEDQCIANWPPLTAEGELTSGEGVEASLLNTFERPDDTNQVSYNGLPLYRYVRDTQPGDTLGQNLGQVFFLVTPAGERITEEITQEAAEVDEELVSALTAEGEQVFTTICAACHGAEGQGQIGPRFDGNSRLGRPKFVINMVLNGFPEHGMPSFRDRLSDRQIAAIATFVRNSWSNDFGAVLPEEVSELR